MGVGDTLTLTLSQMERVPEAKRGRVRAVLAANETVGAGGPTGRSYVAGRIPVPRLAPYRKPGQRGRTWSIIECPL